MECAETNTQLIVRELDEAVFIAFRGTKEPRDFITDAQFLRTRDFGGIEIHHGFQCAYASIDAELFKLLVKSSKPIFITGHSLGGALAMLCAWELAQSIHAWRIHSVYTFGQPRVGNGAFARHYNGIETEPVSDDGLTSILGDRTYRFINAEDIVPRVPGWLCGYRHAGIRIFVSNLSSVLEFNPSLWLMALSDLFGICEAWATRRELTLLTCHGIDRYIDEINSAGMDQHIAQLNSLE